MLNVFNGFRELTLINVILRMSLSVLSAGIIGIERTYKRRPAGFRTHILICLGACMTAMTGQFLSVYLKMYTDISRLGAQVIAGIGFIGAGAIITTQRRQVKGLTTAAGLWATAIMGLCFGCGFIEAGILATVMIFLVETSLSKLEYRMRSSSPEVNIYLEYRGKDCMQHIMRYTREHGIEIVDLKMQRTGGGERAKGMCAILQLKLEKGQKAEMVIRDLHIIKGIYSIEEL